MTLTCPACNKPGQNAPACARCGCDLTSLDALGHTAIARLVAAHTALTHRDWLAALHHAERSWQILHTPEAARLAFLAAAAARLTPTALAWHQRALDLTT
jgi:hypothetical protein